MENKVKLRVFKRETTEKFNEIISKNRKTKDKTFINEIDPYDDNQSQIISDILIDQNSGFSLEGIAVGVVREDVF